LYSNQSYDATGFNRAERMPHTYFFALFPDDVVCDQIVRTADALQNAQALGGRRVARPRLHMTAHFVGRYRQPDPTIEARAIEARERMTCAPFELVLDRAYSFPRDRGEAPGIFAPSGPPGALLSFAAQLRDEMAVAANARRKAVAFRPHVTWLYSSDRIVETAIEPIAWRVSEFALAHALPGQQQYEILRVWKLR
jgi:2'-5' RNA ligase